MNEKTLISVYKMMVAIMKVFNVGISFEEGDNIVKFTVIYPTKNELVFSFINPNVIDFEGETFIEMFQHSIMKGWLVSLQRN